MVHRALAAAEDAARPKASSARVVNMSTVNPLDEAAILDAAKTGAIVTVEEHSVRGGLGGAVAEVVAANDAGADAHHGLSRASCRPARPNGCSSISASPPTASPTRRAGLLARKRK